MIRLRPTRVVVSMVLAALVLTVPPWEQGRTIAATGTPDIQAITMTVPDTGVLTVNVEKSTVSWTYPNALDLGKLDFANTLNDTATWSVSAAMTDLVPSGFSGSCSSSSTNCFSYTNMQLTTSPTFNTISGATPTNMVHINVSSPFAGSDGTPGITLSSPKQVLMAGGTDKGSYSQGDGTPGGDNNLQPTSGLSIESGTYGGTVQYTIMG